MGRAQIIAEVGCNHKGDMGIAREMIDTAYYYCKVDVVKFQKRNPRECLSEENYNATHPVPYHSYGKTYGEHREFLEFDIDQHRELKALCDKYGLDYSCSVWDLTSAQQIVSLGPKMIKIPSACNLNFKIMGYLCEHFDGEIHISLGMTTREEEKNIVEFFSQRKRIQDVVLYACTSGYPVPFEDICLMEITRLRDSYLKDVKDIGFSGHHNGIAVDTAAFTLGAGRIERHFTLDRTWKGTDHAASLAPDGLRRVSRDIRNVAQALNLKSQDILPIEQVQRQKLKQEKSFINPI